MPKEATRLRMSDEQLKLTLRLYKAHAAEFPVGNSLYAEYADMVYRMETALAKMGFSLTTVTDELWEKAMREGRERAAELGFGVLAKKPRESDDTDQHE